MWLNDHPFQSKRIPLSSRWDLFLFRRADAPRTAFATASASLAVKAERGAAADAAVWLVLAMSTHGRAVALATVDARATMSAEVSWLALPAADLPPIVNTKRRPHPAVSALTFAASMSAAFGRVVRGA